MEIFTTENNLKLSYRENSKGIVPTNYLSLSSTKLISNLILWICYFRWCEIILGNLRIYRYLYSSMTFENSIYDDKKSKVWHVLIIFCTLLVWDPSFLSLFVSVVFWMFLRYLFTFIDQSSDLFKNVCTLMIWIEDVFRKLHIFLTFGSWCRSKMYTFT